MKGNGMKGYKQTEVGVIPEDWEIDCIKNLAIIKTGSKNTQDRNENGIYPFFVRSQTVERIDSYSFDGEAVLTAGDGVGVGKVVHYVNEKFDCHQRVYRITDFAENLNGYFFFLYFKNNFLNRIMQMTAKSSVDSVRMEMIANMQIPLPPTISEQSAIATVLSDADALITSLEKLIEKKRAIKQGAMQKLLSESGFAGLKDKQDLEMHINPENPVNPINPDSDKWEVKKLGEIVDKIIGGGTPSRSNKEYWGNDIPWVTVKDFATFDPNITQESITFKGLQNSSSNLIPKGTLITSTRMGLGKAVIYEVDVSINQDLKAVFTSKSLSSNYLYYWFQKNSVMIEKLGSGSTVMGISLNELRNIDFFLPPIDTQTRIATILSDMDSEITALEQKLAKYKQIKQGMMQELLTGRIRLVKGD